MPLHLIEQRAQLPVTACTTDEGSHAPLKCSRTPLRSEVPLGIAHFSPLMIYSPKKVSVICLKIDGMDLDSDEAHPVQSQINKG